MYLNYNKIIADSTKKKSKCFKSQGSVFTKFIDYFKNIFKNIQRNYLMVSCNGNLDVKNFKRILN